jgi:omega-amidase
MKVALASIDISWRDKSTTLGKCESLLELTKTSKLDMIIFPEMTLTGFSVLNPLSEKLQDSWTINQFSKLAIQYKIKIFFGMSLIAQDKKSFNSLICIGSDGRVISRYNKMNLFSYSRENEEFLPGTKPVFTSLDNIKIGNTICYDLRFPELYRQYAMDCHCIVNIANWPAKRVSDWRNLLKARAIENQCIVIGVNRQGKDAFNQKFSKSSLIFLPGGKKLSPVHSSSEIDIYDIDLTIVDNYRAKLPFIQDMRRGDLLNLKL